MERSLPKLKDTEAELHTRIFKAIHNSPAGESLKNTFRWSQFRTNETNEEWYEALGETSQVFDHGWLMYQIGNDFLANEKGRFTKEQENTFILGIIAHDWGEAIIDGADSIGDVSAQIKTDFHEKKESIVARLVINSLNLQQDTKNSLVNTYEQVVEGKDAELNKYFKALEKSEYVFTAMHVYEEGRWQRHLGKEGIKNEIPLVGRVLAIDLTKVLNVFAPEYPNSIGAYFYKNRDLIDEMFAYTLPWLNENTEWMGKQVNHKALAEAFKVKWEEFKNQA